MDECYITIGDVVALEDSVQVGVALQPRLFCGRVPERHHARRANGMKEMLSIWLWPMKAVRSWFPQWTFTEVSRWGRAASGWRQAARTCGGLLLFLLAAGIHATPSCAANSAAAYQIARSSPNPGWDIWQLTSCHKGPDGGIWLWQCGFDYGNYGGSIRHGWGTISYINCPEDSIPPNNLPGPNLGPACHCAGDPINLATGNEFRREEDYSVGLLKVERYYNSDDYVASASIGSHWRHYYDRKIGYSGGSNPTPLCIWRMAGNSSSC